MESSFRIAKYLRKVPIFKKLSQEEQQSIASALKEQTYRDKEVLFRQGDIGDCFHIIKRGTAAILIYDEQQKKDIEVARVTVGDYFGETALLNKDTRSATVQAVGGRLKTLSLDGATFTKMFATDRFNVRFAKRRAVFGGGLGEEGDKNKERPGMGPKDRKTARLIRSAVEGNVLFSQLDLSQLDFIVEVMWYMEIPPKHKLIKQGEAGDNFYVVEQGEFEIFVEKNGDSRMVATRGPGESFGELALMYNSPRAATVIAKSKSKVWAVERYQFRKILMKVSNEKLDEYDNFLQSVPVLDALLAHERQQVAEALDEINFSSGDVIVRQGDPGDTFYIIRYGHAVVYKSDGGTAEAVEVARLGPGDFFGERALIKNDVRSATVQAAGGPIECLCLDREAFTLLLGPLNDLMERKIKEEYDTGIVPLKKKQASRFLNVPRTQLKTIGVLGKGSFGVVKLVEDPNTGKTYAIKAVAKSQVVQLGQQDHVMSEKNVMAALDTPFCVKLWATYKDQNFLYFLLEVCLGGELFSVLRARTVFDEPTAKFYAASVVQAFVAMHTMGIIYRDLKPENLLLDAKGYLKITDFGFAKVVHDQRTWTLCGTPDYLAPEVVSGVGHGKGVDWWTLGILIYEMLASYPPFFDEDPMKTYAKIMHGNISFPKHFSPAAIDMIKKLLHPKPTKRYGCVRGGHNLIKRHPWFRSFAWDAFLERKMKAPIVPKIKDPRDLSNFEDYPDQDHDEHPPYVDDGSNWDADF